MAAIDKTYTDSWKEYQEFKEWAKDKSVTFHYDNKKQRIGVSWYIYEWDEEDFGEIARPVMNTPTWLDKYLKDNCPCQFVQDRLKEVYPEGYLDSVQLGVLPPNFKKNRKIVITQRGRFPIKNKGLLSHGWWWVQCNDELWYNNTLKAWTPHDAFPSRTNTAHTHTIKAVVRQLRKMYLPSGITFSLSGRYEGENYTIKIR
jgi:hypothetical protein